VRDESRESYHRSNQEKEISSIIENASLHRRFLGSLEGVRSNQGCAVGASIQNMLLTIHSMELGGVWLGEILKNKEKVGELLRVDKDLELMAVVALGHPNGRALRSAKQDKPGKRDRLEEKVFLRK
jgi:nitroreductase